MIQIGNLLCKNPNPRLIINEPWHGISNNVVCATSKASDQPAHIRSLIRAFACRLNILGFLFSYFWKLLEGCIGSAESIHHKMPHCLKPHVAAQMLDEIEPLYF